MNAENDIPLEPDGLPVGPSTDKRPRMPDPIPVELLAVKDVQTRGLAGQEQDLDAFYVELFQFVKQPTEERGAGQARLMYEADNFFLIIDLYERLEDRNDYRPITLVVQTLGDIELQLIAREIEYVRQRGLLPGEERLVLKDPAGNWVEVTSGGRSI